MAIHFLRFVSTLCVAPIAGLSFAHLLERAAKLQFAPELYLTIQRTLYVYWGFPNAVGDLGMLDSRRPPGSADSKGSSGNLTRIARCG